MSVCGLCKRVDTAYTKQCINVLDRDVSVFLMLKCPCQFECSFRPAGSSFTQEGTQGVFQGE